MIKAVHKGPFFVTDLAIAEPVSKNRDIGDGLRLKLSRNLRRIGLFSQSIIALFGISTELSGRYHPDGLAVSVGMTRVGMAGWIA